ncbi:polymer-forming cytoskeletal protein [Brevibacillus brevis]|uniref:Polymer-forming cytoskeletal protein n=1 Tax=Brevibacillus brevis TaxID=1393 RepID=A0ABY9T853_BREBE|nr:polymer-forming cytoskeletal protein [Brevibacillus brevis]WNC14593.1 polymer-forming cytoskeletal protein [Brevibacillus brevis]
MNQDNRPDLVIQGSVNASGGVYREVNVQGLGKIKGDLECHELQCGGHVSIDGSMLATSVRVDGNASVRGGVKADTMEIYGQIDVNGDVKTTSLLVKGNAKVHGSLTSDEIQVKGFFKSSGDCEAEVFKAEGAFTIGGLLNAGQVEIQLHGNCQAREIGGEHIEVRKAGSSTLNKILKHIFNTTLTVDTVEGDEIYLEYTRAKVVRGNNIAIGPGCEIDLVEYTGEYRQDNGAQVKEHTKR